ncbi:bifunctional 2-polyprenyl-6-hydroxyphenol methylase/3-demethylubiquinol 3-O-methyltransferase UbiG [Phenylobacterium sp.]|uniref:class I SAM-dependent methyltransferase n=1 Tax=Phenylobacterium sp. TaxID=1871053 RepID=UPI00272226B1|nr:class I SAM-dependent methyltransferase [Phenylobacterium sp.]MDO8379095.1 class I SAM-dependent methyltransferase [Phenylobacterium sp.]
MPSDTRLLSPNDLVGLAQAGWRLGARLCVDCGGSHRIWGTLRAAGMASGLTVDEPDLAPRLAGVIAPGARVLIAGSADGALLDLVVRATKSRPLEILVIDRCATPLAVIEATEPYAGVTVRTRQLDLTKLEGAERWDVIVSHSLLPHLPPAALIEALRRMRGALAPGGRLILVARTFHPTTDQGAADFPRIWTRQALERITAAGVPIPEPAEDFDAALRRHAEARSRPQWDLATGEAIAEQLTRGGFEVLETAKIQGESRSIPIRRAREKQGYVFVAR